MQFRPVGTEASCISARPIPLDMAAAAAHHHQQLWLLPSHCKDSSRLCCHDAQWTVADDTSGGSGAAVDSLGRLEYGQEEQLQVFVSSAAARANAHLLRLVRGKYMLRQHCANIKHFVLLGKGDFVQYLMEHLAPQLSRPSSQLHRHQVTARARVRVS